MSQIQNRSPEQLYQEAKNLHASYRTNSNQIQQKLQYMSQKIQEHSRLLNCGFCSGHKFKIDEGYKRAFNTLTVQQKTLLFWRMCLFIKQIKDKTVKVNPEKDKQQLLKMSNVTKHQRQMLDTTVYIKDKKEYKNWTITRITASIKTRKITITDKSFIIDMHDYIIRRAKTKQRTCFALEALNKDEAIQTIKLSNQGHSFEQTIGFLLKMQNVSMRDQLRQILDPTANLTHQQIAQIKIPPKKKTKKLQKVETLQQPITPKSPLIKEKQSFIIQQKMMTLKLLSPEYGKQPAKMIQKEMIEKQRVIRFRDKSYDQIYKYLVPGKVLQKIQDLKGYEKVTQNQLSTVYYNKKEGKVKKKYKFNCGDVVIFDWLVDQLNNYSNFYKWKSDMQQITCMKVFPSQKTKIFFQTYNHKTVDKKINYLYIRHHFDLQNPHSNSKHQRIYYFFDKSINPTMTKGYFAIPEPIGQIDYILWKFCQLDEVMHLTIEAKCQHFQTKDNNLKMIENYLGDFAVMKKHATKNQKISDVQSEIQINTLMFQNQYLDQIDFIQNADGNTEYFTITDSYDHQHNGMSGVTLKGKQGANIKLIKKASSKSSNQDLRASFSLQQPNQKLINKKSVSFEQIDLQNSTNLLKFKHPVVPLKKPVQPLIRAPRTGTHPQWQDQWLLNPKGQLININKEKIQAQNSVLKGVFKRLGRNLMSGKSILNVSLPVEVFGDDSNLSRLCNSYGYAPIFLQKAVIATDPLERFKKVLSFAMTCSIMYLRMDKPFNPILGETYQSLIDGCLVYGEQISHHPPVSAVFVKGRGFTIYGHLQAKVQLNLNSANGMNEGQIHVSFDKADLKKQTIKYTTPPGQLSGLIYGDRKFFMIRKSYFLDEQNLLFCQLHWGKHKGKSEYSNKFGDAVQGQIVKLKSSFDIKNWKCVKKTDVERQIGLVNGRWTGAVYYGSELLFDTFKTFPHQVQPYPVVLESDVSKRKDLILRRTSANLELAQQAKQQLQQIQRKDRKLREKYHPSGH